MNVLPLVSVIIPTFKRSDMLPRAIESVLNQTYPNIEIIVVDDNDPTTEWRKKTSLLMSKYESDSRIKYIKHDKNCNGSVARNTGIRNANGDIVAFLDDDDEFLPKKIELQVEYLLKNVQYRAVYCGWDRDGVVCPTDEGDLSYNILSGDRIIYTNTIIMWKIDAINCGGWNETFKRHQEASFLLNYFIYGGKIGVVSEPLVLFDISDRSNAAKDPKVYEMHLIHYLDSYSTLLNSYKRKIRKRILIHRYRGVFLFYIKCKDYMGAIYFVLRKCYRFPFSFFFDVFKYIISKKR